MSPSKLTVEAWPVTDPGQADENQDTVLVYEPSDPDQARYSGNLYIVVDGMGAASRGQTASRFTAQRIMHYYYTHLEPDLGLRLRDSVEAANLDLYSYAQQQPELVKVGATLVAAAIRGEEVHIASVGDSRAYLIRDGESQQITRDHTLVQQLLDEQAITPDEARDHPRRDVVLRALGSEDTVRVDIFDLRLRPDDALVLCSDGLTHTLHGDEIASLMGASSPQSAAETLVRKALDRGGKENVSVIAALLRDGAPPLHVETPHSWDGQPASFDQQETLVIRRSALGQPSPATTSPGEIDVRRYTAGTSLPPDVPQPAEQAPPAPPAPYAPPPAQPAPPYSAPEAGPYPPPGYPPAPPYGQPRGYPQGPGYTPPPGYAIDPVTGLPPVPPGGQPGYGYPPQQTPAYGPRIYQPPAQPRYRPRRGVPIGRFLVAGILAILLTALMVVLLVNPMNWPLPFGLGGEAAELPTTEPTSEAEAGPTQPAGAVTPAPTLAVAAPTATVAAPAPPGMMLIEGGPFTRGVSQAEADGVLNPCINESTVEGDPACLPDYFNDAQPVAEVTLRSYYIDVTEVTNLDYAACVAAEVCTPPSDDQFYADPAFGQHPAVYVTYAQAVQYCQWAGKRLPTEAEWEKAARWDPVSNRSLIYPWGDEFESGRANTASAGQNGSSAVQAFSQDISPLGVLGMAGNVSEWVADWYFRGYEGLGTLDPTGPATQPLSEPFRVVRGGSFQALAAYARAGQRFDVPPTNATDWIGFRCVADLPGAEPPAPPTATASPTDEGTQEGTEEALPATITPTPEP